MNGPLTDDGPDPGTRLSPQGLADETGVGLPLATVFHAVCLHVVESALRNDRVLVLPNFLVGGTTELRDRIIEWDERQPEASDAAWELAGSRLAERMNLTVDSGAEMIVTFDDVYNIVGAYLTLADVDVDDDTFGALLAAVFRRLDLDTAGAGLELVRIDRESAIEDWLASNIGTLGFLLDLPDLALYQTESGRRGRQYRFASGRRADLLCRERNDGRSGRFVVVELKAGPAIDADVQQLVNYLDLVAAECDIGGDGVVGVLVADGFMPSAHAAIRGRPILLRSLVDIGYHDARLLDVLGREEVFPSPDMIEMAMRLRRSGLPFPVVPQFLAPKLRRRDDWFWSTVAIDTLALYFRAGGVDLDDSMSSRLPDGDWFAFGAIGHGLQSNFLVYASSVDGVVTASRTPWGNAYGDPDDELAMAVTWLELLNAGETPPTV